jgi:hypothetical protein
MPDLPPIPASCAARPLVGGLVAPFVNLMLADGGVDFRTPHQAKYERCWLEGLCQTCGEPIEHRAVLFGGPNQLASRRFDEPPLCVPCAVYASQACPMVSGRMSHYADRQRVSEGKRGHVCPDAGCGCGGFLPSDPDAADSAGEPAHPWYAVYVHPGAWVLTAHDVQVHCSDRVCDDLHTRRLINGCQLTADPLKLVLVSAPGGGRLWQTVLWPTGVRDGR